jgi:hypothetical protein
MFLVHVLFLSDFEKSRRKENKSTKAPRYI